MRRRKIVKKGFRLTLMVCGYSGMGKSTFINTLCEGDVYPENSPAPVIPTMEIGTRTVDLNEPDGTIITLSVVDTPGFGDNIDNSKCCSKIIDYLKKQFDEILEEESRVKRNPRFIDNRVHVALYFISPTGHGLRELDVDVMTALSSLVNVIPVIAKSDTLTSAELTFNKKLIMQDIRDYNIPIYYFPCDPNDDEGLEECMILRNLVPFAIVGSNEIDKDGAEFVRVRNYPWGTVRVEDTEHSDFVALRSVLFGSHLQELRDITHEVLYEKYRTEKLSDGSNALSEFDEMGGKNNRGKMYLERMVVRDAEDKSMNNMEKQREQRRDYGMSVASEMQNAD